MRNSSSNFTLRIWIESARAKCRQALRGISFTALAESSRARLVAVLLCLSLAGCVSLVELRHHHSGKTQNDTAMIALSPAAPAPNAETSSVSSPGAKKTAAPHSPEKVSPATRAKNLAAKAAQSAASHASVPPAFPSQTSAASIPLPSVVSAPPVDLDAKAESGEQEDPNISRKRQSWFFDQRAYPNKHIPSGAYQKALEQRDLMRQQQRAAFAAKSAKSAKSGAGATPDANLISFPGDALWHLMGPQPVSVPFGNVFAYNGGNPTASGRITAIAVDTTDTTGDTLYVGGAAGGVWKTTNGGSTWTPLTDNQPALAVGSITIDPNNHLTIYVGTGEENFNGDAFYGAGVLKSTDGGNTWTQLGASVFAQQLGPGIGGAYIGQIAVQPGNSNIVLAAVSFFANGTIGGIYRSTDGGNTWTEDAAPQGLGATSVFFESTSVAGTTATAWMAMGNPFGEGVNGIYKSTDSGNTWTLQTGGLPTANLGRITLGYAPSTSAATSTIYAAIADSSTNSSDLLSLVKTTNGGTAWTTLTGPTGGFCNGQCFYDMAIGVHPTNPSVVVIGGGAYTDNFTSLFESQNGGSTWTIAGTEGSAPPAGDFAGGSTSVHVHVDTHAIVFTPLITTNSNLPRLYIGDDGGMWRTDNPLPAAGASPLWVDLNNTGTAGQQLAITQFYPSPSAGVSDENIGFGGTQDNDTEAFQNSLEWISEAICGDGGYTAIDPLTPTTVWAGCNSTAGTKIKKAVFNGQLLNLSNGQTLPGFDAAETAISNSGDSMSFIPPLALDGTNSNNLYFGTCRVWWSYNAASTLADSFVPLTPTWVAASGDLTNGNAAVTQCNGANGAITSLQVVPSNGSAVLAGTANGKVWEASGAGITPTPPAAPSLPFWTEIDAAALPDRTVTAVRADTTDATGATVYVSFSGFDCGGTCGGPAGHVFKSTNANSGAPTWTNITGDLPDIPVNDIVMDPNNGASDTALYVATDVGVFACENRTAATPCQNWTVVGDGLPNSPVLGLAMRPDSRILRAATHGRSMWQIQLTDVSQPAQAFISGMTPAAVSAGAASTAVTLTGTNFSSNTQVQFAGTTTGVTTTFVNTTQLNVTFSSTLLKNGGVFPITLLDPQGVNKGSALGLGNGLPFTVMNPLLDPATMTPSTGQAYTAIHFHLTSGSASEPFVPGSVLAFYDTSNPPNLKFQIPSLGEIPTLSSGGTVYDLTTAITDLTTPGTYQVFPYNPTPGGAIDPLALAAAAGGPVPFMFTLTANAGPVMQVSSPLTLFVTALGANTGTTYEFFQVSNLTGATLTITAASITGTNAANFKFIAPGGSPSCNFESTGMASVAAGAFCFFGLEYTAGTPPGNANSVATLNITDNATGSPQAFPITGEILSAGAGALFLEGVNFGAVALSSTSPTMNATLFNETAASVQVTSAFSISGTNAADFHLVPFVASGDGFSACPTTLPFTLTATGIAGSVCDVSLTFTPSLANAESAQLGVTASVAVTTSTPNLTGVGIEITSISPSIVATGGPAFTLTVNGGGFTAASVVDINGSLRLTTFVNATQLLASIPASDIATAGSLAVTVNTSGVMSEPKTLIVAQAEPASNDNITFATLTTPTPFRHTQDTTQATVNTGGITDPLPAAACLPAGATLNGTARSIWFKFTAPANGKVIADTRFSSYVTILSAWTGTPGALTAVSGACISGNVPASSPSPVQSLLAFSVTSGTSYYVMVTDGSAAAAGGTLTFSLDFASAAPTNDDNATPTVVSATPFSNTVNSIEATANTNGHADPTLPAGCATGAASSGQANSVWYEYTPTTSGTITADTLTSPYITILNVTSGTPAGTQVACNQSGGTGIAQSEVSFSATSGTHYFFMVSAFLGDGGTTNFHLAFNQVAVGPPAKLAFTQQPSNVVAAASITPAVQVTVQDASGNTVTTATNQVTIAIGTNPSGGTLSGTLTATPVNGIASFSNLSINKIGTGYTLAASATSLTGATSSAFNVTAGPAAIVGATSGTPQSATISTAFAAPLAATVTDAGGNPVSGVTVTFTPPASGASGTFAGGVNTATTNSSGVATSVVFTANGTAGTYNVVASATGATSANFALTNKVGAAAKVTATSGTPQSTTISTAFAAPLVATVTDSGGNPVSGVVVTFTPPASGASGSFAGGANTATTNASGVATSVTFTANATAGTYNVVAGATGATSANFALTNTAGAAAKVTATSGTPQSATISTAFAAPLVATVTDSGGNPVNGVLVTFTPPASGASGTFAGGVNTATTNASGVATSGTFTANAIAGTYNVVASATGASSANFALTNKAGAAAKVTATSGTPQSTAISTAFAAQLVATVTDSGGNPVSGVVVTFTPPASGASGTFAGGTNTATTNASGVATSVTFTANGTTGSYNVVASASGATSANFALTNTAGAAAKVAATSGTPQSATISTAFAAPLVVTVTDSGGNPVAGVVVTFTPPASGASGTFTGGNTATSNASGVATSNTFTANGTAGTYNVVASATGATSANFALTNKAGAAAKVTATSGTPQSAAINTAFAAPLVATVTDSGGNPVSGVTVTFTPPASGASGTFAGGVNTATTNASGVATSAVFTANATAGTYNVVASATGATSANFALTNTAGAAAKVTATSGTPQSATISTAFAAPLVATVTDSGGNPVSGVTVTFTPPASGASGSFAGGTNTATTNASGVATSATFTANATAGTYNVVAGATGATSANFALTNKAGSAAKVAATSGTPQSAPISTAFANPLVATVTDSGGNPVSGVTVTFTPPATGASGTFAGGVNTATTNASGVATSAAFTANGTAGSYNVVASATGATSANFALTNTAGAPTKVASTSGTPQSTAVNNAFANPFVVLVTDSASNPVSGVIVTFTPPASGASGTFAGGVNTATTNSSGVATSAAFTANGTAGSYNVVASATGATSANFALTNTAGAAAKVAATSGTPQSATISTAFAAPLVATVTDSGGNPVAGVVVTFTPPASGASGSFAGAVNTATTNASGVATSAVFTANGKAGTYNVVASATGATSANFALTNNAGPAANIAATSGTPQSVGINTAFANPLVATVTDAGGNPVSGVIVTFTPPASGASGTFAGGTNTATTNSSGLATSAVFTANGTTGGPYNVVATVPGVAAPADFALTNLAGPPASITASSGTPQTVQLGTAFATLKALVKDAGGNPVSNVTVTFTAPTTGASGTFSGATNVGTASTDATGTASAPTFTANSTNGAYTVNATVSGVAAPAPFSLTNTAAAPTVTTLTPNSTTAGSAAFTLTVNGTNFATTSVVSFNGAAKTTTFVSATQLTAPILASDITTAGTVNVSVTTPAPGGGTSGNATFTINNPVPTTTSISPTSANAGGAAFTLTVNGTNFVANSVVNFNGAAQATTFKSPTQLTAAITAAEITTAGTVNVTVTNPTPGGGTSTPALQFSITNVQPTGVSLTPSSTLAGGAGFTLTVNGTGFLNGATITFGTTAKTTTFVNNTQLTAPITSADIAKGGTVNVSVSNPQPVSGPAIVLTFTINNPVPTLATVAASGQNHAAAGTGFTLTLTGTNFVSTSVVNFGTNAGIAPSSQTATQLQAAIPASDLATAGAVNVTVGNPTPGGGTTPAVSFTLDGYTIVGSGSPTTVTAGQTASIPITITPSANGFPNEVIFSVTGLPARSTLTPIMVTPGTAKSTVNLMITTTAHSTAPPTGPLGRPLPPSVRLLLISWLMAMLAGIYLARLIRRTPRLRRYATLVPLALILVTGGVLAGCASGMSGTPKGTFQLSVTATSGSFSQSTNATLTVQ